MTAWREPCLVPLSFTVSRSLLRFVSIESVMLSNHLILCRLLLLLPSIFPNIRIVSNESALCIRWPKVLGLPLQHQPSSEYAGSISFSTDWLDLLAVQGTLTAFSSTTVQELSSSALILLHGPALICLRDYREDPLLLSILSQNAQRCSLCFILLTPFSLA